MYIYIIDLGRALYFINVCISMSVCFKRILCRFFSKGAIAAGGRLALSRVACWPAERLLRDETTSTEIRAKLYGCLAVLTWSVKRIVEANYIIPPTILRSNVVCAVIDRKRPRFYKNVYQ